MSCLRNEEECILITRMGINIPLIPSALLVTVLTTVVESDSRFFIKSLLFESIGLSTSSSCPCLSDCVKPTI